MRIFEVGEHSKAFCHDCGKVVRTTFSRRDVAFNDGKGTARDVLVGVCDECDRTVSVPHQSAPALSRARKAAAQAIEANLPAAYIDVLDCAVHRIDSQASTDFRRALVTYFVHKIAVDARGGALLLLTHRKAVARFPEERGIVRRRLSMKVPPRVTEDFRRLEASTELNTTELLKSVVFLIQIRVLDESRPRLLDELRALSAIWA
ncbi:hypothetical protein [Mitsuaria sp. GD03876]|uniref:hypothetical protein n=1 Tax=Mitsuaria sp. GD03876 TaxID=2975399 RepID=UPI00244B3CF1|nr:hypothetical protein [Mitsuaria sp. GD03876]MDH0866381.1 hypothetical protein [Mitsuaria sp. GD03876]